MNPRTYFQTVAAASLLAFLGALAHADTLFPTDDTYSTLTITGGAPPKVTISLASATGAKAYLDVSETHTAFIQFHAAEALNGMSISKATLTIWFDSVTRPGDLNVNVVTSPWTEKFTGPAVAQPGYESTPAASILDTEVVAKQFVSVDVTTAVTGWISAPTSDYGFAIESPDGVANVIIGAKEGASTGYPCMLQVDSVSSTTSFLSSAVFSGTVSASLFSGNGSSLTGIPAAAVTGTIASTQLASGLTLAGTTTGTFSGNGSGLTIPTTSLTGTIASAQLAPGLTLAGTITLSGDLSLPATTSATEGLITQAGSSLIHAFGTENFFAGAEAGNFTMTGANNTALGYQALPVNTTGHDNTATGSNALFSNTTGLDNTATGTNALYDNTTGGGNTAFGAYSLKSNSTGGGETALGDLALFSNSTGGRNTAVGADALSTNSTGQYNVAIGYDALNANTTASNNTTTGYQSLLVNTTGADNTALGFGALIANTTGSSNIALGANAGSNLTTGSSNIEIGHSGVAGESGVIRIGAPGVQTTAFVAGVVGVTTSQNNAVPVVIDSTGNLGTISSSRRYKEDINDMGDVSERIQALRPVTFRYKKPYANGEKPIQFGLIAEEVAEVFPELAIRNSAGQPETVKYQDLTPLLLNEVQKLRAEKDKLERESAEVRADLEKLKGVVDGLSKQVSLPPDHPTGGVSND